MAAEPTQLEKAMAVAEQLTELIREGRELLHDYYAAQEHILEGVATVHAKAEKLPQEFTDLAIQLIKERSNDVHVAYTAATAQALESMHKQVNREFHGINETLALIRSDAVKLLTAMDPARAIAIARNMSSFGPVVYIETEPAPKRKRH